MKYLIINADDFGMSKVFNESILDLIRDGKIKSTTVMVNRGIGDEKKQIEELIELSKTLNLSVGLHLEFKNKDYVSQIESQFQKFKSFLGFSPSHIDIHRSRDFRDSFPIVAEFCKKINVPFRNRGEVFEGVKTTTENAFTGTFKDFIEIKEWVKTLEDGKYYEILFHPGIYDPGCKSTLNKDREFDIKNVLELNTILKKYNVDLVSFFDLAANV